MLASAPSVDTTLQVSNTTMRNNLEELRNEILTEMYSEAEPPLDFRKVLANPDEHPEDWYKRHYLRPKRQREIFEKHVADESLTENEHAQLSLTCITDLGPTGDKQIAEETRDE
jgi:hypothetical protein